jgi:hypothetical protein
MRDEIGLDPFGLIDCCIATMLNKNKTEEKDVAIGMHTHRLLAQVRDLRGLQKIIQR